MDKKTVSTLALFALLSLLPASSSAQTYTNTIFSYNPVIYQQYEAVRYGVIQGQRIAVPAQRQVVVAPQRPTAMPRYTQVAAVASAFEQTAPPQLPKTGGGGKALAAISQANYNQGFLLAGTVLALILGLLSFLVLKKSSEN